MHLFMLLLQVVDEGKKRAIQIEKEGFPDAVVWNPWVQKAAGMADFGDDEYKVKASVHCPMQHQCHPRQRRRAAVQKSQLPGTTA